MEGEGVEAKFDLHFVHTSDWHLGFYQHNKPERNSDYYEAARKTVRNIRRLKPQFVLHTGDLFHHARPSPGAIRQAVGLLSVLTNAGIPIYIIRGNHDGRSGAGLDRGGGVMELLEDLDLVYFLDDRRVTLDDINVEIMGVGYYPGRGVIKRLEELLLLHEDFLTRDAYKIVALHAFVEGQLEDIAHLPLSRLSNLGVDYVGVGHYHIPWFRENSNIYVPGSSEATSSNDWNRPDKHDNITLYSSFFEIKSQDGKNNVVTQQIPVRPKVKIVTDIRKKSISETTEELRRSIRSNIGQIIEIEPRVANLQPMVDIELFTDLKFDQIAQITALLEEEYSNVLHFSLNAESEISAEETFDTADYTHDVEEILLHEAKLTVQTGSEFLNLTTKLIDELGRIPVGRPLAKDTFTSLYNIFSSAEMKSVQQQLLDDPREDEET